MVAILSLLLSTPLGEGYEGVDVETCGAKETPCHGVEDGNVIVTVDGPSEVETNTPVTFVVTINGGPSETYGYFVYFTDQDGVGRDLLGNLLFEVEPNSVTRIRDSNTFLVEFTPPRYAVDLTMRVAAVSSNDNEGSTGDSWNYAEKHVKVEFPGNVEYPGLDISESAYVIGSSVLLIGLALWITFFMIDRRVKKEVSSSGRGGEGGERGEDQDN
jgi:hypothetical protein